MRPIRTFTVIPSLPEPLQPLRELAYNLHWSWDHETIALFRRLDRELWESSGHNPVRMLGTIRQERLEEAASDPGFLAHLERVHQRFLHYMQARTWYEACYGTQGPACIAYFSAEFGLTECIPIYSGGLGILAGDHLKSASDLGIPLVGVGILYQRGYFRQYLSADGWQQESYPVNDFYNMPLLLQRHEDGQPVKIPLEFPGRTVTVQVWRAQVGRVPLFLLDTNIAENRPEDREISDELYGGDIETRIQQEMLLGIGGLRALRAVGFRPYVFHMNEGHSAFLALEHIRLLMEEHGLTFAEAREVAMAGNIFTTHTPVPAGIDVFPVDLVDRYLGHYYTALGISREDFLALGRARPEDSQAPFNMAILAIHLSGQVNAVSRLHSTIARRMWRNVWPDVPEEEIPITWVTNGIHVRSWISRDMAELYDRYLGPRWRDEPADQTVWEGVTEIPDEELWRTHERRRERMVAFARRRLRAQLAQRGASPAEIALASEVLSPEALTIGFARRFAAYKRATLIFQDLERLTRLLMDRERPVQIIFAGKAHPRDDEGKALIRQVVQYASQEGLRHHIVFLEDYDMNVARYLVQGADLWLNTPRRFLEACGTSGMKAAANGVLNISILDGWWDEAYRPEIGWAIGRGEVYQDYAYQDQVESQALYNLLEKEVIPLFYNRGSDGLPRGWIARMKASMRALCPTFNTNRMVQEYNERFYQPATGRYRRLMEDNLSRARALARWKARVRQHWSEVRVEDITANAIREVKVGDRLAIRARVRLGSLSPDDVSVQVYYGPISAEGRIVQGKTATLTLEADRPQSDDEGWYTFVGTISCTSSGQHGYALRVLPHHEDLVNPYEPGLIVWSS